ncbi:unannotated protein [freshwater metagenome]|uniref:Unannotated protein n=1 Tax=freshwater metagenome TaxID=449393 RepID=A0A6J6I3W9_9ZZZZ
MDRASFPLVLAMLVVGASSYVTLATCSTVKTTVFVVTVGVELVGIVIPAGIPDDGKPDVGKPEVGIPELSPEPLLAEGVETVVFVPISGNFLKSAIEDTGVPTSIEIEPFLSSRDPAGITKPFA